VALFALFIGRRNMRWSGEVACMTAVIKDVKFPLWNQRQGNIWNIRWYDETDTALKIRICKTVTLSELRRNKTSRDKKQTVEFYKIRETPRPKKSTIRLSIPYHVRYGNANLSSKVRWLL